MLTYFCVYKIPKENKFEQRRKKVYLYSNQTHINAYLRSLQGGRPAEGADGPRRRLQDSIRRCEQRDPDNTEQHRDGGW